MTARSLTLRYWLCLSPLVLGDLLALSVGGGGRGVVPVWHLLVMGALGIAVVSSRGRVDILALVRTPQGAALAAYAALFIVAPILGVLALGGSPRLVYSAVPALCAFAVCVTFFGLSRQPGGAPGIDSSLGWILCTQACVAFLQTYARVGSGVLAPLASTVLDMTIQAQGAYGESYAVAGRAVGTFANPNILGGIAVLGMCGLLIPGRRGSSVLLSLMGVLLVFLSQSRGAMLASVVLLMPLVVMPLSRRLTAVARSRPGGWSLATMILVGALVTLVLRSGAAGGVAAEVKGRVASFVTARDGSKIDASITERVESIRAVADAFADFPLGTGVSPQIVIQRSLDNEYLRVFSQTGVQGAIVVMSSLLLAFVAGLHRQRRELAYAVMVVLVLSVSTQTLDTPIGMLFWALLGQALGRRPDSPLSENKAKYPTMSRQHPYLTRPHMSR